jgi:hypothetical protein
MIYTHVLKIAAGGTASPLDSLLPAGYPRLSGEFASSTSVCAGEQ